jgi:hypothetical protein
MGITLKSNFTKRAAIALEIATFLAAVVWISKTYWAHRVAQRPSAQNLTLATKLDPGYVDYRLRPGRLHQYNIPEINPERAIEDFRHAAESISSGKPTCSIISSPRAGAPYSHRVRKR